MPPIRRRARGTFASEADRSNLGRSTTVLVTGGKPVPVEHASSSTWTPTTSLELVAWLAVAAVAVGVRALNLDGAPLQSNESALAMESWRIFQRTGLSVSSAPLLIYANTLIFLMLGASDATSRLLPMVAGTLVALSPVAFRSRLGRLGSLVAAMALATSPTLIVASRQVDSTSLSLLLALGLVFVCTSERLDLKPRLMYLGAFLLALLPTSGPAAFPLLLILGGYVVTSIRRGEVSPNSDRENPTDPAMSAGTISVLSRLRARPAAARGALLVGGLAYVVVSTGLGTNPIGLGDAISGPLGIWLAGLAGNGSRGLVSLPMLLLAYEPFSAVFGIVGGIFAIRQKSRRFDEFLVWWAGGAIGLYALTTGFHPTWFAIAVVPLGFLAGLASESLARSLAHQTSWRPIALFVALGLSFLGSTLIAASNLSLPDPNVPPEILVLPALAIAILVTTFAWQQGWEMTWAGITVVGLVAMLTLNVHAAMMLNPGSSLNPAEAFVGTATSPDIRTLSTDVSTVVNELQIGRQLEGRPVTDSIEIATPVAAPLAWYLRQFPQALVVNTIDDAPAVAIVPAQAKAPRGAYAGETFQIASAAPLPGLQLKDLVRWWLYRQPSTQTDEYVKVFVKTQLGRP